VTHGRFKVLPPLTCCVTLKKITTSLRWTLGTYIGLFIIVLGHLQKKLTICKTCELIKQGLYIVMFHSLFIIQYAYITFIAKKEYKSTRHIFLRLTLLVVHEAMHGSWRRKESTPIYGIIFYLIVL